jgi:hypothetical protein
MTTEYTALYAETVAGTEDNEILIGEQVYLSFDREEGSGDNLRAFVELQGPIVEDIENKIRYFGSIKMYSVNATFRLSFQYLSTVNGVTSWKGPKGNPEGYYEAVYFVEGQSPDGRRATFKLPRNEVFNPANAELIEEIFGEIKTAQLAKSANQKLDSNGIPFTEKTISLVDGWALLVRCYPTRASFSISKRVELQGLQARLAAASGQPSFIEELVIVPAPAYTPDAIAPFMPEREGTALAISMDAVVGQVPSQSGTRDVRFREWTNGETLSDHAEEFVRSFVAAPVALLLSEKLGRTISPLDVSDAPLSYEVTGEADM